MIDLLLACVSEAPEASTRLRNLLCNGVDWDGFLQLADAHNVLPLVQRRLESADPQTMPDAARKELRRRFDLNAKRNLVLALDLRRILGSLESSGVPALALKGPALAESVHGDLALRQFCDLDILVRRSDVPRARELLSSLGYRRPAALPPDLDAAYRESQYEDAFVHEDGRSVVELQWAITARHFPFPFDFDAAWSRRVRTSLAGGEVSTLGPEDLLLTLCVHGSKHLWFLLKWIIDLSRAVRVNEGLDWQRLAARARAIGAMRMVALGLLLARDVAGTPVPAALRRNVGDDAGARALACRVQANLLRGRVRHPGAVEERIFHVLMRERLRDRVAYCYRIATTSTVGDWNAMSSGSLVVRPFRLIATYLLRAPLKPASVARPAAGSRWIPK